jgi:hypothetical protein
MTVTGIFDALFVNQLFGTDARGGTVFYPNGRGGRGFSVPAEREAGVKSGVRRLVLLAWLAGIVLAVVLPRGVEAWMGFEMPLAWFLAYVAVVMPLAVAGIIYLLSRLTVGLTPASD